MARILDCVVSYFGLDENERPGYRRADRLCKVQGDVRGLDDRSAPIADQPITRSEP
jgi:hypothetical protein